jgi:hypothetical protein
MSESYVNVTQDVDFKRVVASATLDSYCYPTAVPNPFAAPKNSLAFAGSPLPAKFLQVLTQPDVSSRRLTE